MADTDELLGKIAQLKAIPVGQHLFCPRSDQDDSALYYEEDVAGFVSDEDPETTRVRKQKVEEAQERIWLTLDCLAIFSFSGEVAEPFKAYLKERLDNLLSSCDVCIRVFHQSRAAWQERLLENWYEDSIATFLGIIDDLSIDRIQAGLQTAVQVLEGVEPKLRKIGTLPGEATFALFESLSCTAFFTNEELLDRHFNRAFALLQSNRPLKLQTFVPAMTYFLFSTSETRRIWANKSFVNFKRNLFKSEFDWAVRDFLLQAMQRVQITALEADFVPLFWSAVRVIVTRLDKGLITHGLRGLEIDLYKSILLEHIQLDSTGFFDLIDTMKQLLEKSPTDFWDAMGAISPGTVADQVFNSRIVRKLLPRPNNDEGQLSSLDASFAWLDPFLSSIKPASLPSACRALTNQFLNRLQADQYSQSTRSYCFRQGLRVLDYAFRRLGEGKVRSTFVGQPIVDAMLDVLEPQIELVVTGFKCKRGKTPEHYALGLSMVENAFTLECLSLDIERECILASAASPTGPTASRPVWKTIIRAIDVHNLDLASRLLIAGKNLIGLEPFFTKPSATKISAAVKHFNQRFELLSQSLTDVMERLGAFEPHQLDTLMKNHEATTAMVATLFSSNAESRQAAVEFLKVISSTDTRKEAIRHALSSWYPSVLRGFLESSQRIAQKTIYAPAPSMIKVCSDLIDVMCNSQDGALRFERVNGKDATVTMELWKILWRTLKTIFDTTELWSNMGYDKSGMMDFCRDTMQFADQLFDGCSIFATALQSGLPKSENREGHDLLKELLSYPAKAMGALTKWLRLRDEYLSSKSVTLISKLLMRLHDVAVELNDDILSYIERVLSGDVRTKLTMSQQAELQRALETHLGYSIVKEEPTVKQEKQASLKDWASGKTLSSNDLQRKALMQQTTPAADAFKAQLRAKQVKAAVDTQKADRRAAEQSEFKRKRELEKEAKKKRDAAVIAQAKKNSALRGWSEHTAEVGSGLEGLGVLGKDHAAKGEGAFLSSDESEEDELDRELFGVDLSKKPKSGPKTNIINIQPQLPVKKKKVYRSIKDMRARLAPDLAPLHRIILGWDYYHEGEFPPKSRPDMYSAVPNVFRTPNDYRNTFEPLLTLEAWQGFVKAREENAFKPYEIRVVSRASVDSFQEVGSTMTHADNKDLSLSEGDIVLLSKSKASSASDPHCLARVFRMSRRKDHIEVSYRVMPGNPLQSSLAPKATVYGAKIQSITPLEREFGALLGLHYYDLCDEIIRAKPSPILDYKDSQLQPLIKNYSVNKAQAKAVKSAIDNDAFTLIQGPPGSGKTKTIVAIVGAILSDSLHQHRTTINMPGKGPQSDAAPKKLLVCAPSNAAVDELVMRFKKGIKTLSGQERKINIVRLGRSDAINSAVTDVTLEELVNQKLGVSAPNGRDSEAASKLFQEHKAVSAQLSEVRNQLDAGTVKGEAAEKLKADFEALRRQKTQLGTRIDNLKDNEKMESRQKELNRRRAQEEILSAAHVVCATLSGSGHDMFQNLNIDFETVVVDEAAQCVEMSALIPLKYGCAKCILVGDPKQLPPTVFSKEAARFQYEQSLFVRMQKNHPKDVHLLDTQYRMHPEISLFPSRTFYDGRLLDGDGMASLRQQPWHQSSLLGPYRFFDVQGQHQAAPKGHSLINIAEIEVAMQLFNRLTSDYGKEDFVGKVGIITPYKSQLRELKGRFAQRFGEQILSAVEFNTTDAFQGRESEIIIFSCVRASPAGGIGFLQDIRRMNVGLTRAKSSLWVLGNSNSLVRGQFWRQLVEDAQQRDRYTTGDVMGMLRKHSSTFPAPYHADSVVRREPQIKKEPDSRSIDAAMGGLTYDSDPSKTLTPGGPKGLSIIKGEDPTNGFGKTSTGKRKIESMYDEDVEMKDASSGSEKESMSKSNTGSSTPIAAPDGELHDPTTANNPKSKEEPRPSAANPAVAMPRPKVVKRRPKEVDPFIRRPPPKKPKPS
jgi:senataxin